MLRDKLGIKAFVLLFCLSLLYSCQSRYENQSAIEFAKEQSGLSLPDDLIIIDSTKTIEKDIFIKAEFRLTNEQTVKIATECHDKNFSKLPVTENGYKPTSVSKNDNGYYLLKNTNSNNINDYKMTILNVSQQTLLVIHSDI